MMSTITNKSILWQAQEIVSDILNADAELSGKVTFIPENQKDIDFQLKNALGRQGIVGIVMTPKAEYRGTYQGESLVWELKDFTVQVVENPVVNRPVASSITALDAAMRAMDCLGDPLRRMFATYNPHQVEQGEDNGLIVAQAKFDSMIRTRVSPPSPPPPFFPERQAIKMSDGTVIPMGDGFFSPTGYDINTTLRTLGYSVSDVEEIYVFSKLESDTAYREYLKVAYIDSSCPSIGKDYWSQPFSGSSLEKVVFKGRTYAQIAQMQYYPWGLTDLTKIIALDDTIIPTKVKYTEASGLPDWEGDIVGVLSGASSYGATNQIPNVLSAEVVELGTRITSIGMAAFNSCTNLTSVTIPEGVTSIGDNVFSSCIKLTDVVIGNGVTSIGNSAFSSCFELSNITIPNSVTSIGHGAFTTCSALTELTIPEGVTSIDYYTFVACSRLSSITIPEGVTSIGNNAFSTCTNLKNINSNDGVYLYDGIQTIGQNAFQNSGIEKLSFDNTIAQGIASNAFSGCNQLTDVVVRGVTTHEVMSLENYPWGISNENIIRGDRGI